MPIFTVNYDSILTPVSSVPRPEHCCVRVPVRAPPRARARPSLSSHVLSSLFSTSCEQVRCPRCTYASGMTLAWSFSRGGGGGGSFREEGPPASVFTLHGLSLSRGGGSFCPGAGAGMGGCAERHRTDGRGVLCRGECRPALALSPARPRWPGSARGFALSVFLSFLSEASRAGAVSS